MLVQHPVSGLQEATTRSDRRLPSSFNPSRRNVAVAIIGAALIGYLVHKTPDARSRLEGLAHLAHHQGDLTASDAQVLAHILTLPTVSN